MSKFNLESFAVNAIKSIDEIRGTGADPKKEGNSTNQTESRINAFYRAIGLPAFTTNPKAFDPLNILNIHKDVSSEENNNADSNLKPLLDAAKSRNSKANIPLSDEEVAAFLDNNKKSIKSSIKGQNPDSSSRSKGGLFPMIVNGDLAIFPQSRRVSEAFRKSNREHDGAIYRRPLIELIVLLRLRGDGVDNSIARNVVEEDFIGTQDKFFNVVTLEIIKELTRIIDSPDGVKKFIEDTFRDIGKIRTQTNEIFKDSSDVFIPSARQISGGSDESGELEKRKKSLQDIIDKNNSRLSLLEYDDTISGTEATRNMKDVILGSAILDLFNIDTSEKEEQLKEFTEKEKNVLQLLRKGHKSLDIILGSYSGLSGIDILIVITALFLVEERDLLGLLNDKSLEKLEKLKDDALLGVFANPDVKSSITALQDKVTELFERLNKKIKENTHIAAQSGGA